MKYFFPEPTPERIARSQIVPDIEGKDLTTPHPRVAVHVMRATLSLEEVEPIRQAVEADSASQEEPGHE